MRVVSEAYIPKLEYDTDLLTIVQNISESTSVFGELEADVSLHLQDIKMDMVCVDQSKISAKEVTNSINNATSAEDSTEKVALVDRFIALLDRTDTFVLLTNSFHSEVLHHQLEILLHEYQGQLTKDVLLLLISTAASREVSSLTARSDAVSTAKNLLNELIGIEEIYSSNVLDSKHKDNVRSMKVIPDYCDFFFDQTEQSASSIGEKLEAIKTITKDNDPTICAAIRRKNEIIESVKLIFTLIDQKKNN